MFTANHFIFLGVSAVTVIVGVILSVKKKLSFKAAAYIMLGICIASEGIKTVCNIIPSEAEDGYILSPNALPFHLCSLLMFVCVYFAFAGESKLKETLKSFFVPCAIAGGIMALLIPTNGVKFTNPEAYQCFFYHAGIVWFAFYLIFTKQVDLSAKSYVRNLIMLGGLALASIYINSILSAYGTNYLYTSRPPMENLPVLNLDHGWFVYFLTLAGLGAAMLTAVHLPFMVRERKKG